MLVPTFRGDGNRTGLSWAGANGTAYSKATHQLTDVSPVSSTRCSEQSVVLFGLLALSRLHAGRVRGAEVETRQRRDAPHMPGFCSPRPRAERAGMEGHGPLMGCGDHCWLVLLGSLRSHREHKLRIGNHVNGWRLARHWRTSHALRVLGTPGHGNLSHGGDCKQALKEVER